MNKKVLRRIIFWSVMSLIIGFCAGYFGIVADAFIGATPIYPLMDPSYQVQRCSMVIIYGFSQLMSLVIPLVEDDSE